MMINDIVAELRHALEADDNPWDETLYGRAADEIERLRNAGDALAKFVNHHSVFIPCRCEYGNEGETNRCCEKCAAIIDWEEARRV